MHHFTSTLVTRDGVHLARQCWLPDGAARAALLLVHGGLEHAGRYAYVATELARRGFAVHAVDLRGHGHSEGERANVVHFSEYVEDVRTLYERVHEEYPRLPVFLLGHSVGGVVTLRFALEHPDGIAGVITSGAYLRNAIAIAPPLRYLSRALSALAPRLKVQRLDAGALSRDPDVVRAYRDDPLVYNEPVKARYGSEVLDAGAYLLERAPDIHVPILILHGGADRVADPVGSRELHESVGSRDRTLEIYAGLYHEILNEPERDRVLSDVTRWLEERLEPSS